MKITPDIFDWTQSDEGLYVPPAASSIALNFQVAGTTDNALRSGATTNVMLAAKWAQSQESTLKYVYLRLKRAGTIASGKTVQLRIVKNNAGAPGSLTYGISARVECSGISTSYDWVKFTFPTPVTLDESTTYHCLLEGDYEASSDNCIKWRSKTVGSGGNRLAYGTSWVSTDTENLEVYASIPVVFQSQYSPMDVGDFSMQNNAPQAMCRTADVSDATKAGTLTVDGVTYYIISEQPDGNGTTLLLLSRTVNGE